MRYTDDNIKKKNRKKEVRQKIVKIITYIIIIPIILYNIFLIAMSFINKNETPSFFGIKTFVVVSGSMEPELNIGDIVIVKACKEDELKENDIISFRSGQSVITHRMIEEKDTAEGKTYITKGDNNNTRDSGEIKFSDIEGKYLFKIAKIGKIFVFLQKKVIIIIILVIFYILYLYEARMTEKEEKRKEKRNNHEKENNEE